MLTNLCLLEWEFKTRHSRSAILFGKTMRRLNQITTELVCRKSTLVCMKSKIIMQEGREVQGKSAIRLIPNIIYY